MKPNFWTETPVEAHLIDGLLAGDLDACEAVFRAFEKPVYTTCIKLLKDTSEALDCVQDTFLKVYTRAKQYRSDAPFWSWVRRIAINCCMDHMRRNNRLRLIDCEHQLSAMQDDQRTPSCHSETLSRQQGLDRAFSKLTDQQRLVVWLYDIEGHSHQSIANLFGKSLSFSKTTLQRAHQTMRQHLNQPTAGGDQPAHGLALGH